MRTALSAPGWLAVVFAVTLAAMAPASAGGNQRVVVELFTSQGCSSCPPADAFLGELIKRKDTVALTFPVDYWDYLGWKDTLASASNTRRQKAYAKARGDAQVYTPQMVLNGTEHVIGSHRDKVLKKIEQLAARQDPSRVDVSVTASGDTIIVNANAKSGALAGKQATLWLILFQKKAVVTINRGENSGRKLIYHNVVRQMVPIGKWTGGNLTVKLPKSELIAQGYDGCTVLLQINGGGRVLGVAYLDNWMM